MNFRIVVIYIQEAHALDEWPIGTGPVIQQSHTIQDRLTVAEQCFSALDWHPEYYMDGPDNAFQTMFGAWPIGFYCCHSGRLCKAFEPEGGLFDLEKITKHLTKCDAGRRKQVSVG